jgi:cytochrome c oxidase subunit 2
MGRGRHPRRSLIAPAVAAFLVASALQAGAETETAAGPLKTFTLTASRFMFDPATIEVTQGDRVRLVLHSSDTTHGFALPDFSVKVKLPKDGTPVTVDFVADKAGTFEFKCSVFCGMGHRGMKGRLVVTARQAPAP